MSDRIDQSPFFQSNIEINEIRSKREYPACAWGEGKEVPKRRSNWSRDRPFNSFRRHIGENSVEIRAVYLINLEKGRT